MYKHVILLGVAALCVCAGAAAPKFEKVPQAALLNLKGARGKPIRRGAIFVNGRYLPPPYTVWRRGTAIFVGQEQVTGEVVPWTSFLTPAEGAPKAPAAAKPQAPARSVDDLFADSTPAPGGASAAASAEASGTYVANARTKRLLKRIMDMRTNIDRRLRRGEILFFGSRYAMLPVEDRLCAPLMDALPPALREARNAADLHARLKGRGIAYLNMTLCEDLFDHQAASFQIEQRRQEMKKEADVMKILDAGAQGVVQ